jgi:lipopolysaccharide export system protein LptA
MPIPMVKKSMNTAVLYKLLKTTAQQYEGCKFTYDTETGKIHFEGDEACHKHIVEEVLSFFNKD